MRTLSLFFLLASLTAAAQDYRIASITPALLQDAHTVIRSSERTFDVETASTATYTVAEVVTVLDKASPYTDIYVLSDPHMSVSDFSAEIYNAAGKRVEKLSRKDIVAADAVMGGTLYNDTRYQVLHTQRVQFPYTVVYRYTKTYQGLRSYPEFEPQGPGEAVQRATFTLRHPEQLPVAHRALHLAAPPAETADGQLVSRTWTVENLPAVTPEPGGPLPGTLLPAVRFAPSRFQIDGYTGSAASWADFGRFIYRINAGRSTLSEAMKTEVARLTDGLATDTAKINRLYRYLQDNMRYVSVQLGIGGWQTYDAAYVEANQYGDCKALTYFMRAMLTEVGIEAYPTLVSAGDTPRFEPQTDFVSPYFNHVILHVPASNYWLECTSKNSPPNYLGTFTADRHVLLVSQDDSRLIRTPAISPVENLETHTATITLDERSGATLTDQVLLTGPSHASFRDRTFYQSAQELRDWFVQGLDLPGMRKIEQFEVTVAKERPAAEVRYTATLDTYGSRSGNRIFLPLNLLTNKTYVPADLEARTQPLVRRYGYTERDSIQFVLPTGTTMESLPEAQTLRTDYGSYTAEVQLINDRLVYVRTLTVLAGTVPAEDYPAYRDFWKAVRKMDKAQAVLKRAERP